MKNDTKKETQNNYLSDQQIINIGKQNMRESKDPTHDYTHAETVEKHCLNIIAEYKAKQNPQFAQVDENLLRIAAWWHDCYKATQAKPTFHALFNEGDEAEKIFTKELSGKMDPTRLAIVAEAIKGHNKVWKFRFNLTRINPVLRILLEADGVETFSKRPNITEISKGPFFYRLFSTILRYCLITFYYLYPFSQYTRETFYKNLK